MDITYKKTGEEILYSLQKKEEELQISLEKYNQKLEVFLSNKNKVKAFLLRWMQGGRGYYDRGKLYGKDELSGEEIEEIGKIILKVRSLQENLNEIKTICNNIDKTETFNLTDYHMIKYGFYNI